MAASTLVEDDLVSTDPFSRDLNRFMHPHSGLTKTAPMIHVTRDRTSCCLKDFDIIDELRVNISNDYFSQLPFHYVFTKLVCAN